MENQHIQSGMHDIFIDSIMSREVITIAVDRSLEFAIQRMYEHHASYVLVVDDQRPVGILTERDILALVAKNPGYHTPLSRPASDFMTTPLIAVKDSATLFESLIVIQAEQIRHLPVVSAHGEIVGLVTERDLTRAQYTMLESFQYVIENSIDKRLGDLLKANEQLKIKSLRDPLLDVGNRRAMEEDMLHLHAAARRYLRQYAVVLFDIDYFKHYNDYYGHPAGDYILQKIVSFILGQIRTSDRVYRYGGEELLLMLPETSAENAMKLASRIVTGLYDLSLNHKLSPFNSVTVSAGCAGFTQGGPAENHKTIIKQADQALYVAKQGGRNQAVLFNVHLAG